MKTLYTVKRCKKDNTLFGASHGSKDGIETICGIELNDNWWITDNTSTGKITCKDCLCILKRKEY